MKPLPPLELTPEDLSATTHLCRRLIASDGTAIRWLRTTTVVDRRDAELMRVLLLCFARSAPVAPISRHLVLAHATLPPGYPFSYAPKA